VSSGADAAGADDPLRALRAGLDYHLRIRRETGHDDELFGPMIESSSGTYPMPLAMIPDEVLDLWARAARVAPKAVVRARFADLLWERRYGERPYEWALIAIDAYLAVPSDDFGGRMEQVDSLHRALDLAARLNDAPRRDLAIAGLVGLVEADLERGPDAAPGVVVTPIELLAERPADQQPSALLELLERAIARFGDDPWLMEAMLDIKAHLVLDDERAAVREAQVAAFVAAAAAEQGLKGFGLLHHALELAMEHGLSDAVDDVRVQIQSIPEESLELHEVSGEVEVPAEQIERLISAAVGDDDLLTALNRFGNYLPTGRVEDNRQHIRDLAREFPLTRQILTPTIIGPDGSIIANINHDNREEFQLVEHEALAIRFFAVMATEVLERLRQRYVNDGVSEDLRSELVEFFTTELITAETADRIARAVELYFSDDFDSAASVLAPRLERIVRDMARALGLPIIRAPQGASPGGVRMLGDLLRALEGRIDPSWHRYLSCLLATPTGINLRNRISHGLIDNATNGDAAVLLHAACYLRLLGLAAPAPPAAS
jgi:hypothetical protein